MTNPGATFNTSIRMRVYNVGPGNSVGSLIANQNKQFAIPLPAVSRSASLRRRPLVDQRRRLAGCFNGLAHEISFDPLGVTLPNNVIVTLTYNTTHYGPNPRGEGQPCFTANGGCGYDSLNVGLANALTEGSYPLPNDAYLNSSWSGAYCVVGATGTLRLDAGCWTGFQPAIRIDATGTADLAITKAASPATALVGDQITYTLTAKNNGGSAATGVQVKDILPSNVTFKSATSTVGSCSGTTTVTCTIGNLANGAGATVTIKVTAKAKNANTQNTATIMGNQIDSVPGNNSSTVSTAVLAAQGSAFGVNLKALLISLGPTPSVARTTAGTSSTSTATLNAAGLVALKTLAVSTQIGPGATVNSKAELAKVGLLGSTVAADGVKTSCTATPTGATGKTTIAKIVVAGQTLHQPQRGCEHPDQHPRCGHPGAERADPVGGWHHRQRSAPEGSRRRDGHHRRAGQVLDRRLIAV